MSLYSSSLAHFRERKVMISFRPLRNSDRFLQRESIAYARATFAGSRVFQASSARRTFCIALSRVNGGDGGAPGGRGHSMSFFSRILFLVYFPKSTDRGHN